MGSSHRLALVSVLLLVHTAAAARLHVANPLQDVGDFDVLGAIQTQVNTMNDNLKALSTAIDAIQPPTEPSPTGEPTDEPTSSTGGPSSSAAPALEANDLEEDRLQLLISKNFLSLELEGNADNPCDGFSDVSDIEDTVTKAQEDLDSVNQMQLSNVTVEALMSSNDKLSKTTSCVNNGNVTLSAADKETVQKSITDAETTGDAASKAIDNIVSPPTPAPEDDSGFRAATIALGVLFSLALVAVVVLAVMVRKGQS